MDYLKTAVFGLDDGGQSMLKAALQVGSFKIMAVADKDIKLAESVAGEYGCIAYDDYRQMVMQNQFDCLLVAAGMHHCAEYIRMAMKKKANVLKLAPPARNFEEAAELVALAEQEGVKFAIANPRRFTPSFLDFRNFLQEGGIEQISLVTADCKFGGLPYPLWHTDPKLAGGGVLLRNCYSLIDQIVWNFPAPQQVYSLNTSQTADRQQRLYLTEDTAVVTLKFGENLSGNIVASRTFGPVEEYLKVYSKNMLLTVSDTYFKVSDRLGDGCKLLNYENDVSGCMKALLGNFASSVLSPQENKLVSSGRENLINMAVIDSAYLSARTGMPEEPARIMNMVQAEPVNIWPDRK